MLELAIAEGINIAGVYDEDGDLAEDKTALK